MTAALREIPYSNKQIKSVSAATGVSVYKLKKWYQLGVLPDIQAEIVFEYLRQQALADNGVVNRDTAVFYLGSESALRSAMANGEILPLYDGTFYNADFRDSFPHRFAVLPSRAEYTPVRPAKNKPLEWYPNTPYKQASFIKSFNRRMQACSWWSNDGKRMTIPDGCHCTNKLPPIMDIWRGVVMANAPMHAINIDTDMLGRAKRIEYQAWTNAKQTICNLAIMDDYGVWTYSHGVYNQSYAWHETLYRAVLAIGLAVAMEDSVESELARLQSWINSAMIE